MSCVFSSIPRRTPSSAICFSDSGGGLDALSNLCREALGLAHHPNRCIQQPLVETLQLQFSLIDVPFGTSCPAGVKDPKFDATATVAQLGPGIPYDCRN